MKTINFILTYFGLILVTIFGCIDDSEDKKVKELESIIMKTGVTYGEMDLGKIGNSRSQTIALFEDIENKELLIPETYKVVGALYLGSGNSNKALMTIEKYIDKFPNDAEALFYKGIILKQKNMDYCEYFKRAQELGFEFNMKIKFTWSLENDPCM